MVRKPDDETVPDYSENGLLKPRIICFCIMMIGLVLMTYAAILIDEEGGTTHDPLTLLSFSVGYLMFCMSWVWPLARSMTKKKICRALAALECRTVHCEDDLVFLMGLGRNTARHIIAGDYDYLLCDKEVCRYMPY